jgi:hypothetical protein
MLDRTIAPDIKEVEEVKFIYPKFQKVTENVPFFGLMMSLMRLLDWIFISMQEPSDQKV